MSQEDEKSLSPLFTKMDALLARHRGPGHKDNEVLPVLTDVAEEEGPIPVLTEMASTAPAGSLMFDPHEFLAPPPPAPPSPMPVAEPQSHKQTAEFLDLPLLDLESLLRERAPFGPSHELTIEPLGEEAAPATDAAPHPVTTVPGMDSESAALELAHAADEIPELESGEPAPQADQDVPTLHWEETEDPYHLYVAAAADAVESGPVEDIAVTALEVTDDAPDWSTVSPWWSDQPDAAVDAETLAASASMGFVESQAEAVAETAVAIDTPAAQSEPGPVFAAAPAAIPEETLEHAITLDLHSTDEPPLELDLDEFREEDVIEEAPAPGLHEHIGNSVTEISLLAGPGGLAVEAPEPVLSEVAPEPAKPAPVALLSEDAIIEMTASVAAHLAVDISTEVEQLTRRHFAHMMQTIYGEALTQLIDQVGAALEARLAPRIDKLVREELQARGLTTPDHSHES
ncbi:hypothetical protein HNQ50_002281 [Silvimonas terrae]|uniref:DUF2497 domain-containing protein n=1 Tax=Silvimonas terrae TaxID=300266 RepID=A0A840RH57_9NEIS|nr:hypothetical protein [Silvimonas terrae]MBB5191551.1 hypothetical protein [Silvimonas terrae]